MSKRIEEHQSDNTIFSFAPVCRMDARVLVLGSMPGRASLDAGEYYAHGRNAFWPIMAELLRFDAALPFAERCRKLTEHGIALWDVMRECVRESSLDSDILEHTIVPNDFAGFFRSHPQVRLICFNGTKAEQSFKRYVLPDLAEVTEKIAMVRLPSTSPANASLRYAEKLKRWRVVCE